MTHPIRRLLATIVAAFVVVAIATVDVGTPVSAGTSDDEAQKAAEEIAAARQRANQAAEDYFQAEAEQAALDVARKELSIRVLDLEAEVARLEQVVTAVAVNRYVSSGAAGIPILTAVTEPTSQLHRTVLSEVVTDSSATTLDDYDAAREALERARDDLDMADQALEDHKEQLLQLQAEAEAEVQRLRELEEQRLHDEAVQQALAAMQLEQQRQLEEIQRRTAEAERIREEELDAASVAAGATAPVPVTLPDDDGDPSTPPPTVPPVLVDATGIAAADDASDGAVASLGRSAGRVGGRTGGGGRGSDPRAAGVGYVDFIICPVNGPHSSIYDSWLAPRDGGARLHQGNDVLAPTGTPLVAVVSGVVTQKTNRFGGITISLMGDNGNRYYYAHLSAWEGIGGRVSQGDVVGYVGDTGNATGIPHLHFQIMPGNGVPVNPTPSLLAAGC